MTTLTYKTQPLSPSSQSAARLAFGVAATSLFLLAALHILRADLDPSWRMVSEYAVGSFGWVQTLVFLTLAISCLSLFVAIGSQVGTRWGKIGLGFLLAAPVGMVMAAMFNWEHPLHGLSSIIGIPGFSIAALLISLSVARNPAWASARRPVIWLGHLPWIGFVLMLGTLFATLPPSGEFGPGLIGGWLNRLLFLTWYAWLIVMAWQLLKLHNEEA
jgi:hypothetical protein